MSRFREEMSIIRWPAWLIAGCLYAAMGLIMELGPFRSDPTLRTWNRGLQILFIIGTGLPLAIYTLLVGYVYADAKRRAMRYVMWTLLAALIPNAIGIILYFVMRDPLARPCPNCGSPVRQGFAFCPGCGTVLANACPQCRCAVEPGWAHCVRCGADLRTPARPV
jgi:hypothetical protein